MPFWQNNTNQTLEVQSTPNTWFIVQPGQTIMVGSGMHGEINIATPGTHLYVEPSPVPTPSPSTSDWNHTEFDTSLGVLNYNPFSQPSSTQGLSLSDYVKTLEKPEMTKDDEYFYNRQLSKVISYKSGMQKGDIGLEIECEGTHLFNTPFSYWTCHADGSLRETSGHPPVEYVLKQPLSVPETKEALEYLATKLKESGSKLVKSNRTSVHVHVNCQRLTIRELYCYLCLYLIFEELLVEWSGPDRAGNLFCLRAKDSNFYINMLEGVLKNQSFKQWREDYRYSACNVASITKFGSLEFRSMQGTVDVHDIQTWIEVLMMLKEASQEYDNPIEIVEDFTNIGPLPFFKKIFRHKEQRELFQDSPGLSGKLWDGLRLMRDVAYACEWKAPIKKKLRKTSSK